MGLFRRIVPLSLLLGCSAEPVAAPERVEFRVTPSPGCAVHGVADGIIEMPAGYDVPIRRYRLDIPPWWNGTDPIDVIYFFHACGGDETAGTSRNLYIPVANLTDEEAIIVTGESAGQCWDLHPDAEDVEYIARLRAEIESAFCLNLDEIHHSGISSGAFAAQGFACRYGATSVYAAAGGLHQPYPNTQPYGVLELGLPQPSDCQHPVPVLLTHGRNDPTVSYSVIAIPARDRWLQINGCENTPSPFTFSVDMCAGLPAPCSCQIYDDCDSGAPVVWCEHNGGHVWPGSARNATAAWLGQWDAPIEFPGGGEESSSSEDSSSTGDESSTGEDSSSTGDESSSSSGEEENPSGCDTLLDVDHFDGPGLEQARWNPQTWVDATVAVDAGELAISVPTTAGSRATVRTDLSYASTDFAATIEVASLPAGLLNADIRLEIGDTAGRWVALKTSWGNLQARSNAGSYALLPFNAANYRFWRIRFVAGTMYFETSPDGATFNLFASAPMHLVGNVFVTLRTQAGPGSSNATVRFDDYAIGTGCD